MGGIGYRREIDGLRAVAVVPVILFHAGIGAFSGGYVGVDVFFVISGYLITGILLREIDEGRYSLLGFYERRAKRILPALLLVLACCLPFAWAWMLPGEFRAFAKSLLAVLGFVSNVFFWREHNYFNDASDLEPLLHTWSLAVEEQYYLLFPPLLALLMKLGRRRAVLGLGLAALGSFLLCEYAAVHFAKGNFFLAPTRAWELLAGSLCAFAALGEARRWHGAASWLGLALIAAAVFVLGEDTPFPSHFALLPVGGTVLLILFSRAESGAGRLLALPPFVGIGLISYSLYLWHQPLFAFARLRQFTAPGASEMLALAALLFPLAWLSWRYVELPFRARPYPPRRKAAAWGLGSAALAGFAALALYAFATDAVQWRLAPSRDPAVSAFARSIPPDGVTPQCNPGGANAVQECWIVGGPDSPRRIALYGDSHAAAILPGFAAAARAQGIGLYFASGSGCPGLLGVYVIDGQFAPEACPTLAERQLEVAGMVGFARVFIVNRWSLYLEEEPRPSQRNLLSTVPAPLWPDIEGSRSALAEGLERTLAEYRRSQTPVVLVSQVPQQDLALFRFVQWLAFTDATAGDLDAIIRASSLPESRERAFRARADGVLGAAAGAGVAVADFSPRFLASGRYLWGDRAGPWYYDPSHLSPAGARRLEPDIARLLAQDVAPAKSP